MGRGLRRASAERIVSARIERVFETVTKYEDLPRLAPSHYAEARVRSRRGGVSVVQMRMMLAGKTWSMMTRHSEDPPRGHSFTVIGGDGKGSTIAESLEERGALTLLRISAQIRTPRTWLLRASAADLDSWVAELAGALALAAEA